ncbi:MAG: helix-turn-helix domain-containing protein [Streptomycetaceae bacterium]|nr:helix-turn-helix domain-containing protein [Streptomycetaceae bacterium]
MAVSASVSSVAGDEESVSGGGGDEAARMAGPRPGHAVVAAPVGVSRADVSRAGSSRGGVPRAGADGLGLLQMLLPAAAQALGLAEQLARAAGEASTDAGDLKYQADILRDVLTGRVADAERIPVAGLGALLQRTVVVVVAEPDPTAGDDAAALRRQQDALTAAWTATVRQADPDGVVAGYAGEIVALLTAVPGQGGSGTAREAAGRVRTACARIPRTFSTGISRPVRGLAGLPEAYDQARRAVAAGRRLQGPGAVTDFDRLGVFRLLSLLPPDGELERFADEVLGALARPLDAEAADLRRTLQVLLETNLNVAETSRRLYVHYNTLRYRIGKLERLVGPFTQDSRLRLDLLIALEIVHLAEGVVARGE